MTRKHFIEIAKIMANSVDRVDAIYKLSVYFSLINNKFDKSKWEEACGLDRNMS